MLALMVVAAVVAVVQLGLVGSWARSVRISTLVQAVGVGFIVCAPVTVAVQWALTRGVASAGSSSLVDVVRHAAWTYDPVVEEVVKVAPLVVLAVVWPRAHRQLGWTDHLLCGAALGMGFALCEAALRYGRVGQMAMGIPSAVHHDGYVAASTLSGPVVVPSVGTSLTTWLPNPAGQAGLFTFDTPVAVHLVYSALAALGVAWTFRSRGVWRLLGVVPVAVASVSHAAYNAGVWYLPFADTWMARACRWVTDTMAGWMAAVVLALVVVDRVALARARARRRDLLLPGEPAHGLDPTRLVSAAFVAPPWTLPTVWYVVLERRAALYALAAHGPDEAAVGAVRSVGQLVRARDRARWSVAARKVLGSVRWRSLWSWRTILWLAAVAPAVAYLVVGGFPATRGLQQTMTGPVGTGLLVTGLVAGIVVALSQVPVLVRHLRASRGSVWHEAAIRPAARLATVATTVLVAVVLATRLVAVDGNATRPVLRSYHVLDALSMAVLVLGLALLLMAFITVPPMALAVTSVGLVAIEGSIAVSAGYLAAGTLTVAAATMLHEAAGDAADTGGGGSSEGSPAAESDTPQIGDLKRVRDNRIRQWAHDNGYDTVEAFKEEFVPRGSVSNFDCFKGPDGKVFLVRKGTDIIVPTGFVGP